MSPGLFKEFIIFVPGFTRENEDAGFFFLISSCCFGINQENLKQGESEISFHNEISGKLLFRLSLCCNKLLGRAALRVLSNIHGGPLLQR